MKHLHIDVTHHGPGRDARVALFDGPPTASGRCGPIGNPLSVRAKHVAELVEILRTGAAQRRVPVTVKQAGAA